jgi:DNA-binding Lrp family transcriptional regulator
LAKKVKLAPSSKHNRVQKLIDKGVIKKENKIAAPQKWIL